MSGAQSSVFEHSIRAKPDEIDELGHVSNLRYLRWVLDVALAHSESVGLDFAEYQRLGHIFVVRRHEIDYRRPALAGDEITVSTWIESWRPASSIRRTEIVHSHSKELLAKASTLWALVNLETRRPAQIPEAISGRFASV